MKILNDDFQFLKELVSDFFKQDHITIKLCEFDTYGISGWEIWLQVEFATFLYKLKTERKIISHIEREVRYKFDKRKSPDKDTCCVDFMIQQKHKQSSIPLEIKQNKNISDCIRYMLKDVDKYEKIRNSSLISGRYLWCLGVYPTPEDESHLHMVINKNKLRDVNPNYVFSKTIEGTNFSFTLI